MKAVVVNGRFLLAIAPKTFSSLWLRKVESQIQEDSIGFRIESERRVFGKDFEKSSGCRVCC
jgi:hypothetical protein